MAIENPKYGKGIALAASFDPGIKAPLDSRLTVATIEERDAHVEGNRVYDGMLVYVEADKVTYQYVITDSVGEWKVFGFNVEDFIAQLANDLVTNDETKALAASQGVALKELIDAEAERSGQAEEDLQKAVDELLEYVGTIPEDAEVTNVIAYVNKKAQEVLDAATGGSSESAASVKLQLDNYISENNTRVAAVEKAVADAQADADAAMEHSEAVDARVDVLVGEDANKSVRTIANEELAKQLITEGAKESLDTLAEIAAWIQAHPDDASAMNKAIEDLEALVGTLPEGITATTIIGYIQEVVAAEASARGAAIDGLDERLQAVEGKLGDGEGNVGAQIESAIATEVTNRNAAIQVAQEAAATDATNKANKALEDANAHTDEELAKDRDRLEALEAVDHEHANAEELALIESGDKAKWDEAAGKAHEHANAEELAKIVTGDVEKWNAIADDVTGYVDGEIEDVKALIGEVEEGKSVLQMLEEVRAGLDAKDAQVETNVKAYADQEINKVKATIGEVAEGKTVLQLIQEAREGAVNEAKYDDAQVKADIATNAEAIAKNAEDITALSELHGTDKDALTAKDTEIEGNVSALTDRVSALESVEYVEIEESEILEMFPQEA